MTGQSLLVAAGAFVAGVILTVLVTSRETAPADDPPPRSVVGDLRRLELALDELENDKRELTAERDAALEDVRALAKANAALSANLADANEPPPADEATELTDPIYEELESPLAWLRALDPDAFGNMTLDELRFMRELDLSNRAVRDEDLALLGAMPSLRTLTLRKTNISDAGLAYLRDVPNLEKLGLRETAVTDAGMRTIAAMENLESLDLNTTSITDVGLQQLRGMRSLEFLRLNYTRISGAGLAHLSGLDALERLDLWGVRLDDAGLDHIRHLPALNHLELGATSVSKQWVDGFRAERPECHVSSAHSN